MVRAVVEEAATLASLALFLGMIAIWAQVIATLRGAAYGPTSPIRSGPRARAESPGSKPQESGDKPHPVAPDNACGGQRPHLAPTFALQRES